MTNMAIVTKTTNITHYDMTTAARTKALWAFNGNCCINHLLHI